MSEEVIKILDALAERFGIAIDWTQQNIVPYIQTLIAKYVGYEIATSVAWILICIVFIEIALAVVRKYHKKAIECGGYEEFYYNNEVEACLLIIGWISLGLAGIIGTIVITTQIFDIITCITFPEKIIINALQSISLK